jgi:hypothetical protein
MGRRAPPKRRLILYELHGVVSQKTRLVTPNAVKILHTPMIYVVTTDGGLEC